MGNAGCCGCGGDDSVKRDRELDSYINTHHIYKYPHKCAKPAKQDLVWLKGDFEKDCKTYKAKVVTEILDEKARQ